MASLAIGNIAPIAQTNLKRMLAYSTISHVGFLFMGLANASQGYAAAMLYAICYSLMAAGAFATIIILSNKGYEAENIADFRGLFRTHPWFAAMVLLLMASLAGFPPLFGFWAKLAVIRAAIDGGMLWLAIVGMVFAVIGAYYYLRVIKVMFFDEAGRRRWPRSIRTATCSVAFAVNAHGACWCSALFAAAADALVPGGVPGLARRFDRFRAGSLADAGHAAIPGEPL